MRPLLLLISVITIAATTQRAPLSRLMGLIDLWNDELVTKEERKFVSDNISQSAIELDNIIRKLSQQLKEDDLEPI